MLTLKGFGVYPSIGIGKIIILKRYSLEELVKKAKSKKIDLNALIKAIEKTKRKLEELLNTLDETAGGIYEIIEFQTLLLEDESIIGDIREKVEEGLDVADAFYEKIIAISDIFAKSSDIYKKARVQDIMDLGQRILKNVIGIEEKPVEKGSIIVSDELYPSEVVLYSKLVNGIATEKGSLLSHFAIIARELGIPTVIGVKDLLSNVNDDDLIVVNGLSGQVIINPSSDKLEEIQKEKENWDNMLKIILKETKKPAVTLDGTKITIVANIGKPEEAEVAAYYGAEGVGLFRTEFFFLGKDHPPTEEEQYNAFKFVVQRLSPGWVFIRTLDIGSDKQIPYIPLPKEPNPALGKRAIRLYSDELKEIIRDQIKAILKSSKHGNVGIMIPMVADITEVKSIRSYVNNLIEELTSNEEPLGKIKLGIMVEIPSAALMADKLADLVDFMSIGTNDLTQYTLAVDRAGIVTMDYFDHLHPAVLRLIAYLVKNIENKNVELSVCGESASDIYTVPILIGLGIRKLSVTPLLIPIIKYLIRQLNVQDVTMLAQKAMNTNSPMEVRELVRNYYKEKKVNIPL